MKKKNPSKKRKSPFKSTDKVRVRKSYYTFSKEYPADRFHISRKKNKHNKRRKMQIVTYCILFLALVCVSYFAMSLSLQISNAPIESTGVSEDINTESSASYLKKEGIRALYMPYGKLSDKNYVSDFVYEIEKKNGNCVVIDFKTADGNLAYSSLESYAIAAHCNLFDNDTVRRAVNTFTDNGITVIARIYCFEDPLVSESSKDLAVKYMDTDVNWRDATDENGKSWLNPFSKNAKNYIIGVINELYEMNIRGFMLESVQFPASAQSGATYPGEKRSSQRNAVLKNFVTSVRESLPDDTLLIFSQTANDAANGNDDIYFGSMSDISADAVAADTRIRDESIVLDRREKFSSVISMYGTISQNFPEKTVVPIIDIEEYSRYYIYRMKKADFNSFILIDEEGNY